MNNFQNKWLLNGCLLLIVGIMFLLNFYGETLFYKPRSVHQWRQVDCLSITKNYYEEGMHFLQPKIHSNRAPYNKAVSEFPILNYTVAAIWKVTGEHEFIYRLLVYGIYLTAIFVLFNTLLGFPISRLLVFFFTGLLLTSPLLTFYSFNFLSDVPALSFCIIAFCCLWRFYNTQAVAWFYLALLLATFAMLLKISAVTCFICIVFFYVVDVLNLSPLLRIPKLFRNKYLPLPFVALGIYLVYAWYSFARIYNTTENSIFLLTVLPIWDMPEDDIFENMRLLLNTLFPAFLNRPMLTLFFVMIFYIFFHFKKLNPFLKYCFLLSLFIFFAYLLLFFQVFNVHDYYLVNMFIFPVITFFCLADILSKTSPGIPAFAKLMLPVLFIFNAFNAASFYRLRMVKDDKMSVWSPFLSQQERGFFKYANWEYERTLQPLETIRPELRKLGLKREDRVICLVDKSPNAALYFMDQKGFSFSMEQFEGDSMEIKHLLSTRIPYLILTDSNLKQEKPFKLFSACYGPSLYKKANVEIFRLKN